MSLYIKLIDNPTARVVKPMEVSKWDGCRWSNPPEKKVLVKIHDVRRNVWLDPDNFSNDYYYFSPRFSRSTSSRYEFYHPRYRKHPITVMPGGSTRYAARSGPGQPIKMGGHKIEIRLDAYHLVRVNNQDRFIFGSNLAWLDGKYGHDFGRNFVSQPNRPMSSYLDRNSRNYRARHRNLSDYFRQIRDVFKSRVVRVWVFEGGEGLRFSGSNVHMDSAMAPNIQSILSIAQTERLFIYWCLLSSHPDHNTAAFNKDIEIIRSAQNPRPSSFLNQALRSFCDAIGDSACNFAIDVMNEPEKYIVRGNLSWSDIRQYIRECCRKIKGYLGQSFPVSCGSAGTGWANVSSVANTLRYYLGLGLDFYDFHIYNNTGQLPMSYDRLYQRLGGRLDKPCIIGEFGQNRDGFLDDFQKGLVKNFIEQTWHLGFGGSLVWNYNYKNFDYNKRNTNHKHFE